MTDYNYDDDYEDNDDDYDYRYYYNSDYQEYKMLCYELETIKFSAPPIEGTEYIVPITSAYELYEEQEETQSGVYLYLQEIIDGSHYAYKIFYPQRCTILLVNLNDGIYIEDVGLFSKIRLTKSCYMYIIEWIKAHFSLNSNGR